MRRLLAALIWVVTVLGAPQLRADDVADFYRGKQINLIVGYGPSGGYNSYARVLARYLPKYIPGNPNIVVQNMPGAGSIRATNFIYNIAPRDGTTIATFGRNTPLLGAIKTNQNVQFDPAKFTWLGSMSSFANDGYILVVRKDAKVKSVEDARRPGGPPLILASSAEGSSSDSSAVLMRDLLGFNVKLITGYTDGGMMYVAIERGEVDGRAVALSSTRANRPDWLKPDGLVRVLVVFGRELATRTFRARRPRASLRITMKTATSWTSRNRPISSTVLMRRRQRSRPTVPRRYSRHSWQRSKIPATCRTPTSSASTSARSTARKSCG